ncbi:MAG: hypothetical protein IT350_08150 [Deltaproteobacteria bacterium]|nr:hypothetical protein [Deltaproteobacteria bacterium]
MSVVLTIAGLGMVAAGLDLAHRLPGKKADIAAWLAPIGVLVALAGAIAWAVPGFFA